MTILSPSGLETNTYGTSAWVYIYNKNIDMLNRALLKVQGLLDVDTTNLPDGGILTWDSVDGKWKVKFYV